MINFLELLQGRKSVRTFRPDDVPADVIKKILDAAVYAPTNCNQQLWNFVVVKDAETKEKLIKEAASNTLLRRAPVIVVVSYDGWNYKEAIQGGALAVGNMLLAASYYGVGSLPMNSYGSDKKVKEILGIPDYDTICCFVVLGYPDESAQAAPLVSRKSVESVTHWEKFNERLRPPFTYGPEDWSRETLIAHQRFYCRKTFLGKEMDIMSSYERALVRRELAGISGAIADFHTYDGAYLREFPEGVRLVTYDLCDETAAYTRAAAARGGREVQSGRLALDTPAQTSTLIFKLERLPRDLRQEVFEKSGQELLIVARKKSFLLSPFFWIIKLLFGKDIRKTGIYNFFGPYKPISLTQIVRELRKAGFSNIRWDGYFLIPTFYEQVWQMFRQYIASDGSSYLHREKRIDSISRLLEWVMKFQGFLKFGRLGSVVVIRCKR